MSNSAGIFGKHYTPHIPLNHPLYIKMPTSLATANAGDKEGKYAPRITNPFTGKPLPKISELHRVKGIIKQPSSAADLPRKSSTNKYTYPLTSGERPIRATSISPARPQNGGSRSRRTVHRKHKSYRKSKRVRHTRRKQTRRHRHRR